MAQTELILPKMGESVAEATIIKWLKAEGDVITSDESIVEIATDKVDSEIPSPTSGVLSKILFQEGETIPVGTPIAIISDEGEVLETTNLTSHQNILNTEIPNTLTQNGPSEDAPIALPKPVLEQVPPSSGFDANPKLETVPSRSNSPRFLNGKFLSPLVRKIAQEEGISNEQLQQIKGNGQNGRVTKNDIMSFLNTITEDPVVVTTPPIIKSPEPTKEPSPKKEPQLHSIPLISKASGEDEIIQMDRMRKLIANHMVMSKQTSPHVTSFVEADVSNLVLWRNNIKNEYEKRENEKITFTPIFIEAVSKAIRDFPMINVQVEGDNIIIKKDINIGMAVALNSGNLIVPVIKNADRINLYGLSKSVNNLASKARENKTSTCTNLHSKDLLYQKSPKPCVN